MAKTCKRMGRNKLGKPVCRSFTKGTAGLSGTKSKSKGKTCKRMGRSKLGRPVCREFKK